MGIIDREKLMDKIIEEDMELLLMLERGRK